jgi:hypothetical protein
VVGALALVACLGGARPGATQEQKPVGETKAAAEAGAPESKSPNTGRLSINAGVDWTSAYFFRGISRRPRISSSNPTARCPSSSSRMPAP